MNVRRDTNTTHLPLLQKVIVASAYAYIVSPVMLPRLRLVVLSCGKKSVDLP